MASKGISVFFKLQMIAIAALFAAWLVWDRWAGVLVVQSLCKQDGGERILDTDFAEGYLSEDHYYDCLDCIERIGRREFTFVDAFVRNAPKKYGDEVYLRYSVGTAGEADCADWAGWSTAGVSIRRAGISDRECVRVVKLPEKPQGYQVVNDRSRFVKWGATIGLNEWRVEDTAQARVLARLKEYYYVPTMTSVMDMSGHGGNAQARCLDGNDYARLVTTLAPRVLRDANKKPSTPSRSE